jgi:hypothetical protein
LQSNNKHQNQQKSKKMTTKKLCTLVVALACGAAFHLPPLQAQVTLSGTNYTQNFNTLGSGLPPGWSVRTNASAASLGTGAAFNPANVSWSTATGQFANGAGTTGNTFTAATGTETATQQSAFTNRCLIIRQQASSPFLGNPGAAFVFQIANTVGLSNLTFSVDLNMLSVQTRSTTWTIDYAVGNAPAAFTVLGTYSDPGVFGPTPQTCSLNPDANDQTNNVWIRIAALSAATGSGACDTFGIDNFVLNYAGPTAPTLASLPASRTNGVLTTAVFTAAAAGNPPLYYQWFQGTHALADGGDISGAASDTLTLSHLLHTNAGDYTVVITNTFGAVTSSVATLTVVGFAIAPLPPTNVLAGATLMVPLSFIDAPSPITTLAGSSGNQNILPDADLLGAVADDSGSVTLTPVTGAGGVVLVRLDAADGSFATNTTFPLLVVPSAGVVFNDHFDYTDGPVTTNSLALWRNHSGTPGNLVVSNGALRVSRSETEDANVALLGQPYEASNAAVLYSRFDVCFTELPSTNGNYFAHFKDNSSGQRARIWTATAGTNTAGTFRLGIGNATTATATTAQFPLDLNLNTHYTVVTRLVLATGLATLWINPTRESDPGVTDPDPVTNTVTVTSYAFRQDTGEGNMQVDDLVIATTFNDALGAVPANLLSIRINDAQDLVLIWDDAALFLQSATNVAGPYTTLSGATSPFTNDLTAAPARFFRLTSQAP